MRNLETSKAIVANIIETINKNFDTFTEEQQKIAVKVLIAAPDASECLNGIENNKADSLVKLVITMDKFSKYTKPGSFGHSCIQMIENDLTLFYQENYGIDFSERRG